MYTQRSDETGGVAVMVAVFIAFVVLGIGALAIDGGALFDTQRSLVTSTDAMALAGAGELAEEVTCDEDEAFDIVEDAVDEYREANNPEIEEFDDSPIVEVDCGDDGYTGSVRVRAHEPSSSFFSGEDDLSASGWTEVGFTRLLEPPSQNPDEPQVLSPLAFCENQFDGTGETTVYYSPKGKKDDLDKSLLCDDPDPGTHTLPGGWGWLKDDGSLYEEDEGHEIVCTEFDDALVDDSDEAKGNWCEGVPGNSDMQSWPELVKNREFMFPIFDKYSGKGTNQGWRIVGTGVAELVGCSGSGGGQDDDLDGVYEGDCKGTPQFITLNVISLNLGLDDGDSTGDFYDSYTEPDLSITDVSSR